MRKKFFELLQGGYSNFMNKGKTLVIVFAIIFFVTIIFTGCNMKEDKIKMDCEKWYASQGEKFSSDYMEINKIYEVNNHTIVFYLNRGEAMVINTIVLGDIRITQSDTNFPLVWHKGDIFELTEAYDKKILSYKDAKNIKDIIDKLYAN